jgi:signal transduction histidine kinase
VRTLCLLLDRALPGRTVRFRLTVLYGLFFLLSGALLLAITNVLMRHATGSYALVQGPENVIFFDGAGSQPPPRSAVPPSGRSLSAQQLQAQARYLAALTTQQRAGEFHQLLVQSVIALAIMAAVSVLLGWLVAGRVLRPLRTITATARAISATSLDQRIGLDGPGDELTELSATIDGLLDRLETSFTAQRQFAANVAHELRTPLARQRALIEVAVGDPEPTLQSYRDNHLLLLAAGEQQEKLIEALLTLARSEAGLDRHGQADLATVAGYVADARHPDARRQDLTVRTALSPAPVRGDPALIERLVANLVDNAVRYNLPHGQVEITTTTDAGQAVLAVTNTGPDIPPEDVHLLTEPFRRGGPARTASRPGTGLGLSIVRAIAAAHQGWVTLQARPEGGLRAEVRLPEEQ